MSSNSRNNTPTPLDVRKTVDLLKLSEANIYNLDENGKRIMFIDQIRSYAVRDPSKIKPGVDVLFLHVPQLENEKPENMSCDLTPHFSRSTLLEVSEKTYAELHPDVKNPPHTEPALVFEFESEYGLNHRYATDSGVVPYENSIQGYNSTNFTVLVSELESAGIELKLEVSPEYKVIMDKINNRFNEINPYDESYYCYN